MRLAKIPNFSSRAHLVFDLWQFKNIPFVNNTGQLKNSRFLPPKTNRSKNCGRTDDLSNQKISILPNFGEHNQNILLKNCENIRRFFFVYVHLTAGRDIMFYEKKRNLTFLVMFEHQL